MLKANPAYWGQKPKLDGVVVRFLKEPSARLNELRAGTIDVTANLNPDDLKAVQGDTSLNAVLQPSFNVGFLSLNVRHPALQNDKVRRAISLAVNKKALVTAFYGGLGQSDASFLPPPLAWANSGTVPADYTYDPVLARRLLSEAGFPNGFALTLWYMPVSRPYFPTPKPFAEGIAADLSAVGIKVTLKTEDWAVYLKDRNKPPFFDMYMIGWGGDYGDPDNFYSAYYGKNASEDSGYRPPLIDQLLDQGRAATSRAEKARVYARLHDLTYAANVRLPMVHSRPLAASRSYVRNWITGPLGNYDDLNLVDLSGKK